MTNLLLGAILMVLLFVAWGIFALLGELRRLREIGAVISMNVMDIKERG